MRNMQPLIGLPIVISVILSTCCAETIKPEAIKDDKAVALAANDLITEATGHHGHYTQGAKHGSHGHWAKQGGERNS